MIKTSQFLVFLFLLCFGITIQAQEKTRPVHFANGDFFTNDNIIKQTFNKSDLLPVLYGNNYYVLIQFSALPADNNRKELKNAGVELNEYIPANSFLSVINKSFDFSIASKYNIVSINAVPVNFKIDPALYNFSSGKEKQDTRWFAVSIFPSFNKQEAESVLQSLGIVIVPSKFGFKNHILDSA
jgi:hypothetical protein